jgi:DNA-binding Lrp family transcriptional regulator
VSAYILAKIEAGKDEEVISRIKEMKEIRNAIITYGVYDLIVNVDFERIEDLDNFVFNVLRRIPGIKETMTMVAVKSIV